MDNINFTGLKNIGAYMKPLPYSTPNTTKTHMIINLTDDFDGNDLTEFQQIAKKCEPIIGKCEFPKNSKFIHIMTNVLNNGINLPDLAVNYIVIPVRRETLSMFSFIAKLTKRISQMPNDQFNIAYNFKFGPNGNNYLLPFMRISDLNPSNTEKTRKLISEIYSPENDKQIAKVINQHIQTRMEDYLK